VSHRPRPGQTDAMAAFTQQLEGIKQLFLDDDRQDERFALYGVDMQQHPSAGISIDEWSALLDAVKARLRLAVGALHRPGFNDTPAALSASVLECVGALDQLHVMLGHALLSAQAAPAQRDSVGSPALGQRRAAAQPHVSGVPVSSSPLLNAVRAAAAKD
jgi:hypothetical protein